MAVLKGTKSMAALSEVIHKCESCHALLWNIYIVSCAGDTLLAGTLRCPTLAARNPQRDCVKRFAGRSLYQLIHWLQCYVVSRTDRASACLPNNIGCASIFTGCAACITCKFVADPGAALSGSAHVRSSPNLRLCSAYSVMVFNRGA